MSDPAPGSLNSWHHESSPVNARRSSRAHSSSEPCTAIVGPARVTPPPAPTVPGDALVLHPADDVELAPGRRAEPAAATRVVHPGQPEVVQPAALLDRVVRHRGQQLVDGRRLTSSVPTSGGASVSWAIRRACPAATTTGESTDDGAGHAARATIKSLRPGG